MTNVARKRIAVIATNMDVEYASEIQRGIVDEAWRLGYDVFIFNANVNNEMSVKHNLGQYNIYSLANLSLFSGVIVYSNLIQGRKIFDVLKKRLDNVDIPVVGVDAPIGRHFYVGVENYRAMKAIVEHFIKTHGFTKINYISGPDSNTDSQIRLAAYKDAIRDNGLTPDPRRIFKGSFNSYTGKDVVENLIKSGQELPEAIVCANDDIAIGVISELKKHGIKVPEQISVSGFDNMFEARNYLPRITSVDRSLSSVGIAAVDKIDACVKGLSPSESELFPATPIFSESCGCTTAEKKDIFGIRNKYFKMMDYYEKNLAENNVMMEELNDSKSYEDFIKRLKTHVNALECENFYLCLDKGLIDNLRKTATMDDEVKSVPKINGYARTMSVALAYEKGDYASYADFPSSQMLPWNIKKKTSDTEPHVYVFSPVHFQDVCFGYTIVENSDYMLNTPLFRAWQVNLSHELENLRKHTNLQRMFDKLDRLYVVDSLTGIYNRFGFTKFSAESFEECMRESKKNMIFFVDLDGLKKINDNFGHDKGDLAIKTVAYSLKRVCQTFDVCARFGGDEFIAYVPDCDEKKAKDFCKRFDKELEHYNQVLEQPFRIEASYGYDVFVPESGTLLSSYIGVADEKMYVNKQKKHADRKA